MKRPILTEARAALLSVALMAILAAAILAAAMTASGCATLECGSPLARDLPDVHEQLRREGKL